VIGKARTKKQISSLRIANNVNIATYESLVLCMIETTFCYACTAHFYSSSLCSCTLCKNTRNLLVPRQTRIESFRETGQTESYHDHHANIWNTVYVPRCHTSLAVAHSNSELSDGVSWQRNRHSPSNQHQHLHHCAQPLSKVTHLIIAHFDCRCRVCANARYGATNACKSQGLLNCLATGFVAYGAGVERQGAP
jgi:hypothetical protein